MVKDLQKSKDELLQRKLSQENQRRIEVQASLNRLEKVFAFNSWHWGAGLSIPDALTPVPGMSVRDVALELGEVNSFFASALTDYQVRRQIEFFDTVDSDTPVATQVFSNMGLSWLYRGSTVGEVCKVLPESGAFIHKQVLKDSCREWVSLPNPEFSIDEELHARRMEVYARLTDESIMLIDDLVPLPIGSVFGTASRLRGDSDLLMDFRICPDEVHALMRFLTESARAYNAKREQFLQTDVWSRQRDEDYPNYIFPAEAAIGGVKMYLAGEDHISYDMFSEDDYLEFVYPYQRELADALSVEWYVHSCGNLTPFYKHIASIPNIRRVHISAWSSLETAVDVFGNTVILEIHQPVDFDQRSSAEIDYMADHLIDVCNGVCTMDIVSSTSENGRRYNERIIKRHTHAIGKV